MKLTEMVMHGVESGLKSAVVVNGRKVGGGRRDGRASFSMVSADTVWVGISLKKATFF